MTPQLQHRSGKFYLDNSALVAGAVAETFLASDAAASSSTLTVKNIIGLGINQILLIGEMGTENAEIILTHASTTPSGTTVTLASSTVKAHTAGEKVRVLVYNQVELNHATTATGSKTNLTVATTANFNPASSLGSGLVAIDPTTIVQVMESSEHSSGYYFARYKNSITADFSGYTDALQYGGWSANTVGFMIAAALKRLGKTLGERVTREFCYDEINEALRFIKGKQLRWAEHYGYNVAFGVTSRGNSTIALPSDIYSSESNESILAIRQNGQQLDYLSPSDFARFQGNVKSTQVRTQATTGDTSLAVDNSYDFAESGNVKVYIAGTAYSISYTGVTRDDATGGTAALTGIPTSGDGAITLTIPVDTNVWQGEIEGTPLVWTVKTDGSLDIWPLPDSSHDNQNIYGDYNKIATVVDSDGDTIDFHRYGMVLDYLTWKIKMALRNDGTLDQNDGYYVQFKEKLNDAIRNSPRNNSFPFMPKINTMSRLSRGKFLSTQVSETTDETFVFYSETPTGAIDSNNVTYTVTHAITTVFSFAIGTAVIHPSEYTYSGSTITMLTPLDISLASEPFTIVYQ